MARSRGEEKIRPESNEQEGGSGNVPKFPYVLLEDGDTLVAEATHLVTREFLDSLDGHDRALLAIRLIRSLDEHSQATLMELLNSDV